MVEAEAKLSADPRLGIELRGEFNKLSFVVLGEGHGRT
jgi:hypothetical protein